jgi:DNA-binding winged helix-turn-helix (wHTH) protein
MSNKKIQFDDFEIDYGGFQLLRNGLPVHLEGLPLQLLLFLANKSGVVVTRDEITHELWSDEDLIEIETGINTAIRKIRRALGDDAETPRYLQTVMGRGYRFVTPDMKVTPATTVTFSPEELGQGIKAAAGLDSDKD